VGKTTTIAKLANRFKCQGKRVVLSAADTFRAAAIDQLEIWANRIGVEIIKHQPGADPGAVVFDSIQAAIARNADVVIVDTAGRLHTKTNLMEELKKVGRIVQKALGRDADETLLVLDATTGQNAVMQAREFMNIVPLTGIALAKIDGTAKGGIVVTIKDELGLPIKLAGSGEKPEDLEDFSPQAFVEALFE
jgi:fused signal recognition particle receptor